MVGKGGRGIVDHFHLHGKVDVEVGTLSKAFGVMGGVVAGSKRVMDYLRQKARPFLFSSAVTPADVAACIAAVDVLEESTELVDRLWDNTRYMKHEFTTMGFDTGASASPVIPLVVGEDLTAFKMTVRLQEEGVFANPVVSPAVPEGRAMMRTSYMATHTREHLDRALEAFRAVGREMGVIS